jgi:hypothetical protein
LEFLIASDDVFVITPLPERGGGVAKHVAVSSHAYRFETRHHPTERCFARLFPGHANGEKIDPSRVVVILKTD